MGGFSIMKKFLFLIISILILASCEYENPPLALGAEENGILTSITYM